MNYESHRKFQQKLDAALERDSQMVSDFYDEHFNEVDYIYENKPELDQIIDFLTNSSYDRTDRSMNLLRYFAEHFWLPEVINKKPSKKELKKLVNNVY